MTDIERMELGADWLQRLQEAPQDETVLGDWLRWYQSEPENAAAFDRVHSVWDVFDDASVRAAVKSASSSRSGARRPKRFFKPLTLAASALLVVGLGSWWIEAKLQYQFRTLTTNVAEESKRVLSDGSKVALGASSRVTARYSKSERTILLEDGEAYFDVKKDALRPFVVRAGALRVVAVGTAFTVKRVLDRVTVTVSQGVVRVEPDRSDTGSGIRAMLKLGAATPAAAFRDDLQARAGDQVTFLAELNRLTINKVDPQAAWPFRDGVLHFVDVPLKDVLVEVNRFSPHPISLPNSRLQNELYTGTVYEDRIDDWLEALTQAFPVQLTTNAGGDTVLLEK